jgi:hypothetical protein
MGNFLIFSGALAMTVGLLAIIEGNLHCFGIVHRKKGIPWSPRLTPRGAFAMRFLRVLWR